MPIAQRGQRFGGRQKGTPNKHTASVQAALLESANILGGKEKLVGYFVNLGKKEPVTHAGLMKALIPLQMKGTLGGAVQMVHSTMTQKEAIEAYSQMINADATELIRQVPSLPLVDNDK